jgi:hypothetical protein
MTKKIFACAFAFCMGIAYGWQSGIFGAYNPALMEWWLVLAIACYLMALLHYGRDL